MIYIPINMNGYTKYLSFIADEKNRKMAIENIIYFHKMMASNVINPDEEEISNALFKLFIESEFRSEEDGYRYDIDRCILLDFPLVLIADILEKFVNDPYVYAFSGEEQIVKLIYNLWPKYTNQNWKNYDKTYPHNRIFNCLHDIKESLFEFEKLDTPEKLRKRTIEKGKRRYYNWHLLGFYPLLGDEGVPSFLKVITHNYDDAQDMIMFSLAQYDPKQFINHFEYILEYWDTNKNIKFETGTGMIGELRWVIRRYKKRGVNVYDVEKIRCILERNGVYDEDV